MCAHSSMTGLGDVAETSPRPAGDCKKSPKIEMYEFSATTRRPG